MDEVLPLGRQCTAGRAWSHGAGHHDLWQGIMFRVEVLEGGNETTGLVQDQDKDVPKGLHCIFFFLLHDEGMGLTVDVGRVARLGGAVGGESDG